MNMTRKLTPLIACVVASCALAACGSSSSSSSSSSSASASAKTGAAGTAAGRTKLEACLKQHGVTLPSRPGGFGGRRGAPGAGSGGGTGTSGSGGRPPGGFPGGGGFAGRFRSNPKLQAAFKACGADFGGGRRFGGAPRTAQIAKFVTCVHQHGYQLPKPNLSGKGPVFPAKIEANAKFKSASKACASVLTPPRGAPGQSTSASSSA